MPGNANLPIGGRIGLPHLTNQEIGVPRVVPIGAVDEDFEKLLNDSADCSLYGIIHPTYIRPMKDQSGEKEQAAGLNRDDLTPFIRDVLGRKDARVANERRLTGGASKEIWLFEVTAENRVDSKESEANSRYVLRRSLSKLPGAALPVESEFEILRAAFDAGVRVPRPHFLGKDAEGRAFFIMDFVDGETLAPRILNRDSFQEARELLIDQMAENLAAIHSMDVLKLSCLGVPPSDAATQSLNQFEQIFRSIARDPYPVFELAFRVLSQRKPEPAQATLVHGDFRLGNFIVGPEGLRSVLDWELSHLGDPAEDLAWPSVRAWRFGNDHLPVAGIASREKLLAAYLNSGGRSIDPEHIRWWEIFGNLRWGVITLLQAAPFLHGQTRDIEKAVIGRRATEVEAELLNLIEA